jgi:hypothetical protein
MKFTIQDRFQKRACGNNSYFGENFIKIPQDGKCTGRFLYLVYKNRCPFPFRKLEISGKKNSL